MLRGIGTVTFYANDLEAAGRWYAELLGIEPYFNVPGYIEFRIGDYQQELGFVDSAYAESELAKTPSPDSVGRPAGAVVNWHVDDVAATLEKLLSMGAKEHDPLQERGGGFVTASVIDPFGNILGVNTNPHYLEVLNSMRAGQ